MANKNKYYKRILLLLAITLVCFQSFYVPSVLATTSDPNAVNHQVNEPTELVIIDENAVPLSAGVARTYSIANVIIVAIMVILSVVELVRKPEKGKVEQIKMMKVISLMFTMVSVLILAISQDFSSNMVFADGWTILLTVVLLGHAGMIISNVMRDDNTDENSN